MASVDTIQWQIDRLDEMLSIIASSSSLPWHYSFRSSFNTVTNYWTSGSLVMSWGNREAKAATRAGSTGGFGVSGGSVVGRYAPLLRTVPTWAVKGSSAACDSSSCESKRMLCTKCFSDERTAPDGEGRK